jgi:hypothetical protein
LQTPQYLTGGEEVRLSGFSPDGELAFCLPRDAVSVYLLFPNDRMPSWAAVLDTVLVEPDEMRVHLTWRAKVPAPEPLARFRLIDLRSQAHPRQRPGTAPEQEVACAGR